MSEATPQVRIIHTEFQSKDAAATRDFLTAMFGASSKEHETPAGPLYDFTVSEHDSLAVRNAADHEPGAGTTVYFETTDLEATLAKAEAAGATVIVPKMTFAGRGYIAWVEDKGGVRIAFLQRDTSVQSIGEISDG